MRFEDSVMVKYAETYPAVGFSQLYFKSLNFLPLKSTQEIANRLVELCRIGDYATCYQELYSPDAVSIEPDHAFPPLRAEGMDAIRQKGEVWQNMIEEVHGGTVGDPIVAGDYFACHMMADWTMKGQGRVKMEEICLYKVENGKIVSEQFIY